MKILSYYTFDTPYMDEARKLAMSLDVLGLKHEIAVKPNLGSWDLNTKHKVEVIRTVLERTHDDVLFIDADATFHGIPEINTDCPLAAHVMDKAYWGQNTDKRAYSLMSGTLWFKYCPEAFEILDAWDEENKYSPKVWDQHNLEAAIDFDPRTGAVWGKWKLEKLDARYCAIDRTMPKVDGAIIRHHQASRRLKKKIK